MFCLIFGIKYCILKNGGAHNTCSSITFVLVMIVKSFSWIVNFCVKLVWKVTNAKSLHLGFCGFGAPHRLCCFRFSFTFYCSSPGPSTIANDSRVIVVFEGKSLNYHDCEYLMWICLFSIVIAVNNVAIFLHHPKQLNEYWDPFAVIAEVVHVICNELVCKINTTHPMIVVIDHGRGIHVSYFPFFSQILSTKLQCLSWLPSNFSNHTYS